MSNILKFIKKYFLKLKILKLTKRKTILEWKMLQYNKINRYYTKSICKSYNKMLEKLDKIDILLNEMERQYNKYNNIMLNNVDLLNICKITEVGLGYDGYYRSVRVIPIDPIERHISILVRVYSSDWKVGDECILIRYEYLTDYLLEKYKKFYKVSKTELAEKTYLLIPYNDIWVEINKIGFMQFSISINYLK